MSEEAERQRLIDKIERKRLIDKIESDRVAVVETEMPEQPTSQESSREAFDELNIFEQGLVGMAKPIRQTFLGAKDLVTDLSEEEKGELRTAEEGIYGAPAMAGEILTEVGMMAIPGGAMTKGAAKAAKYAPKLMRALSKAPKTAALMKDIGLTASMEGLKAPTDDVSRLERAAMGTAGAVGGAGAAKGLGKFFGGAKTSDAAKVIESLGDIPMTSGQRTTGLFRAVEKTLAGSPLTSSWTKEIQEKGLSEWRSQMVEGAGKVGRIPVKSKGRAGMVELKEGLDAGYKKLWSKDIKLPTDDLAQALRNTKATAYKRLDRSQLDEVNTLTDDLVDKVTRSRSVLDDPLESVVGGRTFDDIDSAVQEAVDKAYDAGNARQGQILKELRADLRKNLPSETKFRLTELDKAYQQYSNLSKASTKAHAGDFTGSGLERQIQKGATTPVIAGTAPMQKQAENAVEVFDYIATSPNPPTLERFMNLMASIPLSVLQTPPVRAIISGKAPVQVKARQLAEILRKSQVTAGRVGGAVGTEDREGI